MRNTLLGAAAALILAGCVSNETPVVVPPPSGLPSPVSQVQQPSTGTPTPAESGTSTPAETETPAETGTPTPGKTPGKTPAPSAGAMATTPVKGPTLEALPSHSGAPAPKITRKATVNLKTDAGDLTIELYPEVAPLAAKKFYDLVKSGFYDNTPIFRVVPGFVVQFGVNSKRADEQHKNINDEPSLFKMERGTLAFAKAGPNTASTQVFISLADTTEQLVRQGFTAFGKVTKGMESVDKFKRVGDPSYGLDQGQLWADTDKYLASLPDKPNMILKGTVAAKK